jgi:hypothetical protein
VQVLKECIARAGGLQEGLRYYVGAALLSSDGGYAAKVLAEQAHMRAVADGRRCRTRPPIAAARCPPMRPTAPGAAGGATPRPRRPGGGDAQVALLR